MQATHTLKLADGYGTTKCQMLSTDGVLAVVLVKSGAYWERPREVTRVVRLAALTPVAA